MAIKTNFPTINLWTTQSSLYSHETRGGVWVVIAISSIITINIVENIKTKINFHETVKAYESMLSEKVRRILYMQILFQNKSSRITRYQSFVSIGYQNNVTCCP